MGWIAPAFLYYGIFRCASIREGARLGGLFGFSFCFVSLSWIYHTCRFAGVPVAVSLLAMTCLAALLAVSWALYGAAARFLAQRYSPAALPWLWAAAWTAVESAGAHWTPRVGVDLLAYTQYKFLPLIQIGALLGPHALGFLIALWGGAVALLYAQRAKGCGKLNVAAAGLLIALCTAYGEVVLAGRISDGSDRGSMSVSVLQPNIDQYQKWNDLYEDSIRRGFNRMLASVPENTGLVLWPESSLPGWLEEPQNAAWVASLADRIRSPMIVGTVFRRGDKHHNAAVLVDETGTIRQAYQKRRLVPFGEFVPLRSLFSGWIGILGQMGDFDPGELDQDLMIVGGVRIAANICYEAVFPHLLRRDSARGARVFVNLTNDGWYKDTAGPYQHFYTNMFRAVENRVTVVRAANTGISGVIDPYGVVIRSERTALGEEVRLDVRPFFKEDPFPRGSFFSRTGDLFGYGMMLVSVFFFWCARKRGAV